MPSLLQVCELPLLDLFLRVPSFGRNAPTPISKNLLSRTLCFRELELPKNSSFRASLPTLKCKAIYSSHKDDSYAESTGVLENSEDELGLLDKPSPLIVSNVSTIEEKTGPKKLEKDEVLEPFLKFFKPRDLNEDRIATREPGDKGEDALRVNIDYYDPKPGDFVVGVVISGNENKLDVNVGADMLGTMLTKEVMPLHDKELKNLLCEVGKDGNELFVKGRTGIVSNEMVLSEIQGPGKPVIETGTVLFAEVLGRTLSGRPLLSTRRLFRRVAWHRVRQLKQLNEPFEVIITEWNTGGLLARIEGLRAFLPKAELLNKINNFHDLKQNVGRRVSVLINRIDEANNDLILSEREAWEMTNLREGALLEGVVKRIFSYGAQIRIGDTNRSGLLHISKVSQTRITSVEDVLKVDDRVKVIVVESIFPDKISLSIADLEREPGLFISDRERVFAEAQETAELYRKKLAVSSIDSASTQLQITSLPFDDHAAMYANWNWFIFERD